MSKNKFRIKAITFFLVVFLTNSGLSQIQLSDYPYSNPEWTYLQKWVDYMFFPPMVSYSFFTCKAYGDSIYDGKQFMRVGSVPVAGPNAYNYYHRNNDSLLYNIFSTSDSTNYVWADYTSAVGADFSDNWDTTKALWNDLLLDGTSKKFFKTRKYGGAYDTIIEDIGSLHEPWYHLAYTTIIPTNTLICFKNGTDVLYYKHVNFTHGSVNYVNPCASLMTSFTKESNENLVSIFPNPSQGSFMIYTNVTSGNIQILNTLGAVVYRSKDCRASMNLEGLPKGIYFLQLTTKDKNTIIKKIIVQ